MTLTEYAILFVLVVTTGAGLPGPGDASLIAAGTLAGEGRYKTSKHFDVAITDDSLAVTREQDQIDAEADACPARLQLAAARDRHGHH